MLCLKLWEKKVLQDLGEYCLTVNTAKAKKKKFLKMRQNEKLRTVTFWTLIYISIL